MKIYKINLEPLDWFFFGGEKTFDNSVKQSYIAFSNTFPQQTALLGMLRYQLLKQKGLLFEKNKAPNLEKVNELIGSDSFMMGIDRQSFGAIEGLSPVFLERRDISSGTIHSFYPSPLTHEYELTFDNSAKVYLNGQVKTSLIDDNATFSPKSYEFLLYQDQKGNTLQEKDIFVKRMQIGITKNTDADSAESDEGLYKKELIMFKNDNEHAFSYAFYVSIDNDIIDLENDFVFLGAERSCFKMTVQTINSTEEINLRNVFIQIYPYKEEKQEGIIMLLSPTYVKDMDRLNSLCRFHWSCQMPFRNITRVVDGKLNSGDVSYERKEICYHMLCAGSVLFFDEKDRPEIEQLLNEKHLQTIGYNYF